MANLPISGLTASASNAAATDVLPVVQTTGTGPVKMTVQQMAGGLLGSTTLSGATITADAPVLNMSQTWNNGAVTFTGLKFNAAGTSDANSAAASLLMDLQVNTASRFRFTKNGAMIVSPLNSSTPCLQLGSVNGNIMMTSRFGHFYLGGGSDGDISQSAWYIDAVTNNTIQGRSGSAFGFSSSGTNAASTIDTILTRRAAANLRLGAADAAAPVAQTLSVQSITGTNASAAAYPFTITGAQGTGTGAGGSIIFRVAPAGAVANGVQNGLVTFLEATSSRLFNVYGAFTDASNYERLTLNFTASNDYTINVNKAGTGSNRSLTIETYGNSTATFESETLKLPNNGRFAFSSTSASRGAVDLILARDAANTLALRNGTNAQAFRVYDTFTDASNGVWSEFEMAGLDGRLGINVTGNGTGVSVTKRLVFQTDNVTRLDYGNTASSTFTFHAPIIFNGDNTHDIGASGGSRARSIYAATSITPGRGVTVATLPTPTTGMIARVTDASAPVIGTTVAGGGAAYALVNYNGANWTVIGV